MEFRYQNPHRSNISPFELSVATAILDSDRYSRFGIGGDTIRAVYFHDPPSLNISRQLSRLPNVIAVGVENTPWFEDPMIVYDEGCLDDLVLSISDFDLELFLSIRFPFSPENFASLSKHQTLKYLRIVGSVNNDNVDHLKQFKYLESMTLRDCKHLSCDRLCEMINEIQIPEMWLSAREFGENQRAEIESKLASTKLKWIG